VDWYKMSNGVRVLQKENMSELLSFLNDITRLTGSVQGPVRPDNTSLKIFHLMDV
jgi:hypothetical protein